MVENNSFYKASETQKGMKGDNSKKKGAVPKQFIGKTFDKIPKARQREIASMGGKALKDNPNAKLAGKLREMKKRGLNDSDAQWMYDMMTDSELASVQILEYLQKILQDTDNPKDMNVAMKTVLDWNKMKHGTQENNAKIVVGHVLLTPEEREKEVIRLLA